MRIIAGKYRSRRLACLPGLDLRPTSDKLRGTLFNVWCAGRPEGMEGAVFLDLYAGTGAVGIEALSRGAEMVHFVEHSREAAELIRDNLRSLGETQVQILEQDAPEALRKLDALRVTADFVFLDPPYGMTKEYASTLEALGKSNLLKAGTIVVAEHEKRFDPGNGFGSLVRYRKLEQGDTALSFYRTGAAGAEETGNSA